MEPITFVLAVIILVILCACMAVKLGKQSAATLGRPASGDFGEPIEMEIWGRWFANGPDERIASLSDEAVYFKHNLPNQIHFRMTCGAKHDSAFFYVFSPGKSHEGWGPGPRTQRTIPYQEPHDGTYIEAVTGRYKAKGAVLFGDVKVGMKVLYFTIE